jgi:hypothetical protein
MNTQTLIEKITKAITFVYKSDGTAPGLTISSIPHNSGYYVSVVRWIAGEKEVVCADVHQDLTKALLGLSNEFLKNAQPPITINPLDELVELIAADPAALQLVIAS